MFCKSNENYSHPAQISPCLLVGEKYMSSVPQEEKEAEAMESTKPSSSLSLPPG